MFLVPVFAFQAMGQVRVPEPGDCMDALAVKDSIVVCERPGRGVGRILEVKENPATDVQWLEREHNTTWYRFRAPVKTTLTFDIIPQDPEDDLDFLLFPGNIPGVCEKIMNREVQPVRSNISRNDKALGSRCGLSREATEDFVRAGVGSAYSRAIDVEAGDLYYILVDYPNRPRAGFTLHFHYDPPPPPVQKEAQPQTLLVTIADSLTGSPLEASIAVEGMVFDSIVEARGQSRYLFKMDYYRNLRVNCQRKGYMFTSRRLKASGDSLVQLNLTLIPIEQGAKVVLDDIHFVGNGSKVLRNSEGTLHMLLHFMEDNPQARIEILGHVNGPKMRNTEEMVELSTARAQTVFNFLLVNEVDATRLAYVGLGNSQMLYPEPKSTMESNANRRVEVRITSYDELATPSATPARRSSH